MEPTRDSDCREPADRDVLELRVESLTFELELAQRVTARLESELRRLQQHAAALEADRAAIRNRLDERERYLLAVQRSIGWRALQWTRGLVGRRW